MQYEHSDYYLAHHGTKGMKWGVRRYVNKDGTLTQEGKRKYGSKEKAYNDLNLDNDGDKKKRSTTKKFLVGSALALGIVATAVTVGYIYKNKKDYKNINRIADEILKKGETITNISSKDLNTNKSFYFSRGDEYHNYIKEFLSPTGYKGGYKKGDYKGKKNTITLNKDLKIAGENTVNEYIQKYSRQKNVTPQSFINTHYSPDTRSRETEIDRALDNVRQKFEKQLKEQGYSGVIDFEDRTNHGYKYPTIMFDNENKNLGNKLVKDLFKKDYIKSSLYVKLKNILKLGS